MLKISLTSNYLTNGLSASQRIISDLIRRKISIDMIAERMNVKRYMVIELIRGEKINANVCALNRLLKFYMEVSINKNTHDSEQLVKQRGGDHVH